MAPRVTLTVAVLRELPWSHVSEQPRISRDGQTFGFLYECQVTSLWVQFHRSRPRPKLHPALNASTDRT